MSYIPDQECRIIEKIKLIPSTIKLFFIEYCAFAKLILLNYPIKSTLSILGTILILMYSLNIWAMNGLLGVDKSFFIISSLPLELWSGYFSFLTIFLSSSIISILLIIVLIFLITTLPIFTISNIKNEKNQNNSIWMKLLAFIASLGSIFLVMCFLFWGSLYISITIISNLQKDYISQDDNIFCHVYLNEKNYPKQYEIVSNSSVPYKLLLMESKIMYYQPNQSISVWHEFTAKESEHIKNLCDLSMKVKESDNKIKCN